MSGMTKGYAGIMKLLKSWPNTWHNHCLEVCSFPAFHSWQPANSPKLEERTLIMLNARLNTLNWSLYQVLWKKSIKEILCISYVVKRCTRTRRNPERQTDIQFVSSFSTTDSVRLSRSLGCTLLDCSIKSLVNTSKIWVR